MALRNRTVVKAPQQQFTIEMRPVVLRRARLALISSNERKHGTDGGATSVPFDAYYGIEPQPDFDKGSHPLLA